MKPALLLAAALLSASSTSPAQEAAKTGDDAGILVGNWEGTLAVPPGLELQIVIRVVRPEASGPVRATLDVPDQEARGIPVDSLAVEGDSVTIGIRRIGAEFKGTLDPGRTTLSGRWRQGPMSLPLGFAKVAVVSERKRPQTPKAPFPYRSREVKYPSQSPGVTLAGTLTWPQGEGPFPAVLLVTGSGPQDRDETLMGHKPFLLLADTLTRRGVAVLRVDDRGFGKSTGTFAAATSADFADDARGGIAFLKAAPEVDPRRIGIVGHSEGGVIGPMVAAKDPGDVAFLVLLAGTGMPGDRLLVAQQATVLRSAGASEPTIANSAELMKALLPIALTEADPKALDARMRAAVASWTAKQPEATRKELADAGVADSVVARLGTPWIRYFLAHDPLKVLAAVKCPVLAVNGELDTQVAARENLEGIAKALKDAGNDRATTRSFPKLNHLFQTCETGSVAEYARIEETINPAVLQVVADWVVEQSRRP